MTSDETRTAMPEDVYDFWPWPGVGLLNDKPWPDGVEFLPKTEIKIVSIDEARR